MIFSKPRKAKREQRVRVRKEANRSIGADKFLLPSNIQVLRLRLSPTTVVKQASATEIQAT